MKNNINHGLIYKFVLEPSKFNEFSFLTCQIFIENEIRTIYLWHIKTTDWQPKKQQIKPNGIKAIEINEYISYTIGKINDVINHLITNKLPLTSANFFGDYFNTKFQPISGNINDNFNPFKQLDKAV